MSQIRNTKELFNATAAGTGTWVASTNGQWDDAAGEFTISMEITVGDTIRIETTNDVEKGDDGAWAVVASPLVTKSIDHDSTYTGISVKGPWLFWRAVKVGVTGNANIQAFI